MVVWLLYIATWKSTLNESPRLIALTYSLVVMSLADNLVDECSSDGVSWKCPHFS